IISFDDASVCASDGIFRNQKPQESKEPHIRLIPNPASEWVDVVLIGAKDGICRLSVYNGLNQISGLYDFNCADKTYRLNTSKWKPGIYSVRILIDQENYTTAKIVIIR
ncbi:MAG: T9SS type A sorting domain-containing protein, partial [Bacteroidota bacterium]